MWEPKAFCYQSFAAWLGSGAQPVVGRAAGVARELLASHRPTPIPVDQAQEIRCIARDWPQAAQASALEVT